MNTAALQSLKSGRFFEEWEGFVSRGNIDSSELELQRLVDRLIESGPMTEETTARSLVDETVKKFNDLNDGWIVTIEREGICEKIYDILDAAGFEPDEDWFSEREW